MGGIKCVTPASSIVNDQEMVKISNVPSAKEIGEFGSISIATFESGNGSGLKSIFIEDLHGLNPLTEEVPLPQPSDILWMCGKWLEVPLIPGWKGFMHSVTRDLPHETSKIVPLPFVNSPPSNYDTIYTVLKLAVEESIKLGQNTCFVTFDQPLYVKARDIVAASTRDPLISKISVQVRLGGFHLLMSFLGCIGYIMAGSGLKELLSLIYAPTSVEKMLSGHAYARAVRAHLLTQMALAKIILDTLEITDTEREEIKDILSDFFASPLSLEAINQNSLIIKIHDKMKDKLHQLKENGATAALWIQYFQMVALMKEFIHAERSGNWNDHLCCIQQMIPFFHASGHLLYAKASQLYLQDMLKLQSTMEEEEWEKFVNEGYFTIRRTDAFWSGIWSDMTIEQTLMRSMKCNGGLTRGRGVTDSVLCKWILGTTATHNICASLEDFSGLLFSTVEQHVDFRESRQLRDNEDVNKLSEFFSTHPPFPVIKEILSLATGVVGDETVNCYDAIKVGQCAMGKIIGKDFLTVKLARKDKVLPLAAVSSSIKIHGEIVPIDPLLLFQRIAIGKQTREELVTYFAYELAPFPLSLFNEGGMRKTKKSSLYDIFEKSDENVTIKDSENIIDGGFLLHRVIWRQNSTFSAICMSYANYIQNHYGENCTVVFDGYSDTGNSTKKAEQNRRCTGKVSADIQFTENMTVTIRQEEFLSNANNKTRLINMLSAKLNDNRIAVRHSTDDADTLIVNSAIDKTAVHENVVIVGEDVDLLVLLIALTPPEKNIYFIKPGKGKIERSVYSSQQLQSSTGLSKSILFLHAFSGCDTTSAIFQKGKIKSVRLFQKNPELQDIARIFSDCNSSHKDVARAGERFFLRLYGAQSTRSTSLDNHRYSCFAKSVIKIRPNIASLPPTAAAAEQHCYRVYQQVQKWQGNELSPELWGWKRLQNYLAPITTLKPAAPETLLNLVFCKCMTGCGSMCGCRKAGMNCTTTCANCNGDCLNSAPLEEDEDIYDEVRTDPTRLSQPSVSSCVDDIHMAGLTESADASCSSSNVNVVNLRSTKKATKKLRR